MALVMIGMRPSRILAPAVSLFLVLAVAACGGEDTSPSGTAAGAAPTPEPAATVEPTQTPPSDPVQPAEADPAATPEPAGVEPAATTAPAPEPAAPAPEPAATVEPTQTTTPPAEPIPPVEPDPRGVSGAADGGPADLQGRWEGAISIPGPTDLPFAVDMTASDDGLRGTIDIQGVPGLPLSDMTLDAGRIHFELNSPLGLAVWDGEVRDGVIEGEFTQSGMTAEFWMQRFEDQASGDGDGASFRREEVVFSSGEIVLAGELTLPDGDGPHPAAVLISGSGDQDRDSDVGGFRLFAVLADHLAGAGIASLRFDDRGVGGSTGDGLQATLQDRAGDVEAAVGLLRSRDDIAAGSIGLVGHSEGGIVAPVVANRTAGVAFVALLAAPAVPPGETLAAQQQAILEDSGATAEEVEQFAALQQLVFRAVATDQGWDEVEAAMRALVLQQFEAFPEQMREAIGDEDAFVDSIVAEELATWQSPWFKSFFEHDPRPAIVALDVPVIALYGELDTQVPAAANSTAMSEAIAESNVPSHTIATIFSANHLFQEATTGSVNEYARLEREFVPDFLDILMDWLAGVTASGGEAAEPGPVQPEALAGAWFYEIEYHIPDVAPESVFFDENGVFVDAAARVESAFIAGAAGGLNDDSVPDAVAVLATNTGGTGRFYTAHAIIGDEGGGFRDVASRLLGDRITVQGVEVVDGVIEVLILNRGADESFSTEPHIATLVRLVLEGGSLTEMSRSQP